MKKITIVCLLMFTITAFAQNSQVKVNITSGSAEIKLDGKYVATAFKGNALTVYATPGNHKLLATCGNNVQEKKVKFKKDVTGDVLFEMDCPGEETSIEAPKESVALISAPAEIVVAPDRFSGAASMEDPVFLVVEEPATFNGGDLSTFSKWIEENIQYPDSAWKAGIEGKVYIQFAVNKYGEVGNIKILRGIDPLIDAEAYRVIMSSPKWNAPKQGGRPVKQLFTIPVFFKINKETNKIKQ